MTHITEISGHFVGEFKRVATFGTGGLDHLQAMLVGPGNQPDVASLGTLETSHRIGRDCLIGMADVRLAIGIAYGGRDIEWLGHCRSH
jgi:hypothetical protein